MKTAAPLFLGTSLGKSPSGRTRQLAKGLRKAISAVAGITLLLCFMVRAFVQVAFKH